MTVEPQNSQGETVAIIGGGLAGLSAGSALADAGYHVELFERRPYLGGRASSYELPGTGEVVDNCQHVLLGCCTNLIDFYRRLGVEQQIRWYDEITFILPGGRSSTLKAGALPAPLHAAPSFLGSAVLDLKDKLAIARAMIALVPALPKDEGENFLSWLLRHGQTQKAINRFWAPVLVSALNDDLDRVSVRYAAQVFRESFLKSAEAGRMGVPAVPLSQLYGTAAELHRGTRWQSAPACIGGFRSCRWRWRAVLCRRRRCARRLRDSRDTVQWGGEAVARCAGVGGAAGRVAEVSKPLPSPEFICGSTARSRRWNMPYCWSGPSSGCFTSRRFWPRGRIRQTGSYVELVVSSSKTLVDKPRGEIIELAVKELGEFFPIVREAKLTKATVIKEVHATFSPTPGSDAYRPSHNSPWPRLFLAGDWTATGWPSTMEGAVRSGYGAAEALSGRNFQVPDLPAKGLMRLFG